MVASVGDGVRLLGEEAHEPALLLVRLRRMELLVAGELDALADEESAALGAAAIYNHGTALGVDVHRELRLFPFTDLDLDPRSADDGADDLVAPEHGPEAVEAWS